MSQSDETEYREGVVLDKPVKEGRGSFVNVGLKSEIQIDKLLQTGLRVTVRMEPPVEGIWCEYFRQIVVGLLTEFYGFYKTT